MKTTLYVRQDIGSGDPIVLLHGIFADGSQWDTIAEYLKKDYRVIVVDVLGHGRSPAPKDATYSPNEHALALRNALENINATKNLTIVGYSMGGAVALSYCQKYPHSVEQLYLLSTPFYLQPEQMIATNYAVSVLFTKTSQALYKLLNLVFGGNKLSYGIVDYGNRSKKFHAMIGANDTTLDAEIIRLNLKNMIAKFNFAGKLADIASIPTTFYAGKKDPFIVQGQLYALKRFSPNMDIRRLDIMKVDHMLVQNLPKEMVRLVSTNKERTLHIGADQGTGEVLILLHGIESSSSYWHALIPSLAEHRRVIAIDLLGFGKSPAPKNIAYSLTDHVEWLHRTIQDLDITSKLTIAGHSLGSLIALAYSAAYSKDIANLILLSPVLMPDTVYSKKLSVNALQKMRLLPDSSFLYAQAAESVGDDMLRKFLPSARTIENAINKQDSLTLARKASNVPVHIVYGTSDPLVDASFVSMVAEQFTNSTVTPLLKQGHNFPIFSPGDALIALDGDKPHKKIPKKSSIVPASFVQQISRLAVPVLFVKSLFYLAIGILLFTDYAPVTLTLGIAGYVIVKGYKIIRGAFSLKNEGLSYVGYILLGLIAILCGYGLFQRTTLSLKIAVLTICGVTLAVGLARILVAIAWTKSKVMKRTLLASGIPMALLATAAFAGSTKSIFAIVYAIAIYMLFKAVNFGWYTLGALSMAFIRGFNKN